MAGGMRAFAAYSDQRMPMAVDQFQRRTRPSSEAIQETEYDDRGNVRHAEHCEQQDAT